MWIAKGTGFFPIEVVFGSVKIKVNSVFPLFKEDLTKKQALIAAMLYNLNLRDILTIISIKAHIFLLTIISIKAYTILCFLFVPPTPT